MKAAQDQNTTLLHFLVRDVCEHAPDLCGFVEELEPIENAVSVRLTDLKSLFDAVERSVDSLQNDLDQFEEEDSEFLKTMCPFAKSAENYMMGLAEDLGIIIDQAAGVLAMYGEDSSKINAEDPLLYFLTFIHDFRQKWTVVYNDKLKEDDANKRKEEKKLKEEMRKKSAAEKPSSAREGTRPSPDASLGLDEEKPVRSCRTRARRASVIIGGSSSEQNNGRDKAGKSPNPASSSAQPSPGQKGKREASSSSSAMRSESATRPSPGPKSKDDSVTLLLADAQPRKKVRTRTKRAVTTETPPNLQDLI